MCGIGGFSFSENAEHVNAKRVARAMLLDIEVRGRDATGFAFMDPTGAFQIHKAPLTATDFVRRRLCIPRNARTAILHTRAATQGSELVNDNNHPIPQGHLVGVHNGIIWNDHTLWGDLVGADRRRAEVDSEVIFAGLAFGKQDSGADVLDVLKTIEGPAAVAWLDQEHPDRLMLARAATNPLIIGQTADGSLLFASREEAVIAGAEAAGLTLTHIRETDEGNLLTVEHGYVDEVRTFEPARRVYSYSTRYFGYSHAWDDEDFEWEEWKRNNSDLVVSSAHSAADAARTFIESMDDDGRIVGADEAVAEFIDRSMFDFANPVPARNDLDEYLRVYIDREVDIDQWFQNFKGTAEGLDAATKHMKAFVRPGDKVTTKLQGTWVEGEIVALPNSFPGGKFILRVAVNKTTPNGQPRSVETVLVERQSWEFNDLRRQPNKPELVQSTALN